MKSGTNPAWSFLKIALEALAYMASIAALFAFSAGARPRRSVVAGQPPVPPKVVSRDPDSASGVRPGTRGLRQSEGKGLAAGAKRR